MTLEDTNFYPYIYRVLKQVHPETGLSGNALSSLNNIAKITIEKIMLGVNQLMIRTKKKTVSTREIQTATRLILPGDLAKGAVSEGTKAVTTYLTNKGNRKSGKGKLSPVSRSTMAGLQFPVTRVQHLMMNLSISTRKTDTAAVYLAAVVEYLITEILDLTGNAARDNNRARIIPRHMVLVVRNDPELDKFYKNTIFSGGILPYINSAILPK